MSEKDKNPTTVYAASATYLDPLNCDSTVAYKVVKTPYGRIEGIVSLTDCAHKIDWYFNNDDDDAALRKADAMLDALQEFRKHLARAQAADQRLKNKA